MSCITGAGGTVGGELLRQLKAARMPFRAAYFSARKAEATKPYAYLSTIPGLSAHEDGEQMAKIKQKIKTFLWYDHEAEEAANYYVSVFPHSKIISISHYNSAVPDKNGSVMMCKFELAGQESLALNGGSPEKFNDSISLLVECETQAEIDKLWSRLTAGGSERPCGWLIDKFGLSWQIAPSRLLDLVQDPDDMKASRAMQAMFSMKKIIIADIERAVQA